MTIGNFPQKRVLSSHAIFFLAACLFSYIQMFPYGTSLSYASQNTPNNTTQHAAFAENLTLEEREWLDKHPEITVSNEFDWPPFDFVVSGKPQGFGIDLMKR